ncbi:MAG: leucine zipper domain-containing protein [Acidobacteriota bacterium]|nr:leucine zipper domain-containing protein [Acidobacteriota bacterium]
MTQAAVERAMKLQDVMLRAMAKRITWFQAAELLGISCRQMQRWHTRFEHEGYEGLFDRRRGVPSPKRVPLAMVEEGVLPRRSIWPQPNSSSAFLTAIPQH